MNTRGDIETDFPAYLGWGLLVLFIMLIGYLILKEDLFGALEHLKNFFRFG